MKPSWTSLGALPSSGEAPKRDPFWGVCPRSPPNIPLHGSSEKLPRLHTIRAESKPALLQEAPTCSQECSGRPPQARNRYPTGELLGRCKCVCCAWLAASCLLGVGAVRRRAQGSPRTLWPTLRWANWPRAVFLLLLLRRPPHPSLVLHFRCPLAGPR